MLKLISLKELRPNLPKVMRRIDRAFDRYVISRRGQPVAVMLSIDDYESLIETLNERADSVGLRRVRKALREAGAGRTVDWALVKQRLGLA